MIFARECRLAQDGIALGRARLPVSPRWVRFALPRSAGAAGAATKLAFCHLAVICRRIVTGCQRGNFAPQLASGAGGIERAARHVNPELLSSGPRKEPAMNDLVRFLFEVGHLKRVARSGWWVAGVRDPESVAEHSFRCAWIGYLLAQRDGAADAGRVTLMCLANDLHEARVNDQHKIAQAYVDYPAAETKAFLDQAAHDPRGQGARGAPPRVPGGRDARGAARARRRPARVRDAGARVHLRGASQLPALVRQHAAGAARPTSGARSTRRWARPSRASGFARRRG